MSACVWFIKFDCLNCTCLHGVNEKKKSLDLSAQNTLHFSLYNYLKLPVLGFDSNCLISVTVSLNLNEICAPKATNGYSKQD